MYKKSTFVFPPHNLICTNGGGGWVGWVGVGGGVGGMGGGGGGGVGGGGVELECQTQL